jgi:bla regulator protein blaR1
MMDTFASFIDTLFVRLVWTAGQATVLIGVVWLLGRSLPRLSPAIRCMLWWLVALQLVLGMTVGTPFELHWKASSVDAPTTITSHIMREVHDDIARMPVATHAISASDTSTALPQVGPAWSWPKVIVLLWLLGVLLQVLFAIKQWRESRALVHGAQPMHDTALHALCAEQAHLVGLRHIPHMRVSDAIVSPQVTGLWRPLVLLPADQTLSSEELAMAMAHELAHLHRGDLWLGWVPAMAQCLFFFHPLVRWAMREYAVYREAACDAQVLQRHQAAPQTYGHLLLRLGVAHPVHAGLAGASSTFQNLKRRLIMLQQSVNETTPRGRSWLLVVAIALAGVLPYRVTATNSLQAQDTAQTANSDVVPMPALPPVPPVPPAPAMPPSPPPPPSAHNLGFNARFVDIDTQANANRGIALFDGNTVMVNGSDRDLSDVQHMRKKDEPMLWFRRGNNAYVVHDANVIRQAKDAYAPLNQLTQAQSSLASKQGELAGQQGGLAARTGALASRQAEVESRRASIEAQRAALQADSTAQETAANEAGLNGQLLGLKAEEAEISRENMSIDRYAAALSKQEAELAQREAAMSKQQKVASDQVDQQLDKILDEAIAKGLAEPTSH